MAETNEINYSDQIDKLVDKTKSILTIKTNVGAKQILNAAWVVGYIDNKIAGGNTALEGYLTKAEAEETYATKGQLSDYLTTSDASITYAAINNVYSKTDVNNILASYVQNTAIQNMVTTNNDVLTSGNIIVGADKKTIAISNYSLSDLVAVAEGATNTYIIQDLGSFSNIQAGNTPGTWVVTGPIATEPNYTIITDFTIFKIGDIILNLEKDKPDYYVIGISEDTIQLWLAELEVDLTGMQPKLPKTGSDIEPIYVSMDGEIEVCKKYAGGTNISLNNVNGSGKSLTIFAPTLSGNQGEILVSGGTNVTASPTWQQPSNIQVGYASYIGSSQENVSATDVINLVNRGLTRTDVSPGTGIDNNWNGMIPIGHWDLASGSAHSVKSSGVTISNTWSEISTVLLTGQVISKKLENYVLKTVVDNSIVLRSESADKSLYHTLVIDHTDGLYVTRNGDDSNYQILDEGMALTTSEILAIIKGTATIN